MSRPVDPRLLAAAPAARRLIAGYAVLQAAGAALTIGSALATASALAGVVHRRPAGALAATLVALALLGTGRALVGAAQEWLGARGSLRVRADLRAAVVAAVRRLGPGWTARQPGGRLATAAGPGLEVLDGYLSRALPALVSAAVVPGAVLAWMLLTDWRSGVLLVVVLPLVPLFMALVGITTGRRMQRQYQLLATLSGHFLDLVAGLTTLRVYGRAGAQVATVRRASDGYRRHTMATLRTAFLSGLVLDLVATLSVALVAVDVGLRLDHGSLSLRTALVVLLLAPELFAPLRAMGAQHHAAEEGRIAAAAALDVIAEAAVPAPAADPVAVVADGAVRLAAVTVRYPGRAAAALDGLDLAVRPGELVALCGRSGAGKTTLLATLLGLATPVAGTIEVGTVAGPRALADVQPGAWRENLAWLPQRPRPTQPTVGDEVALGDPEATPEQVADAIATCHAPHPRTPLGEDGAAVSAGQRRRVALARAVLRARRQLAAGAVPLLLLDEPSEDLDAATEQVVASVVGELAGRATVVMATHSARLTAVADRVVELGDGRLVGERRPAPVRERVPARVPDGPRPPAGQRARSGRRPAPVLPAGRTARLLATAGVLCGLTGLAGLALTATSIWLICRASEHPNVQALGIAVVGVRTFALARALLRYLERLVSHDGALRLLADVRSRVFAALVPLVPTGVDLRRGDLLRRFVTDVDGVQEGLVRAVVPTVGAALTGAGAVALAGLLVPAAGGALAAGLLVGLLVAPLVARLAAGPGHAAARLAAERDSLATGLVDGLTELAVYGADGIAAQRCARADAAVRAASRRPALGAAAGVAVAGTAAAVTLPLVLAAGADAAARGTLTGVSAAVLAAGVLAGFDALAGIPAAYAAWGRFRAGLRRVADLLATPVPVPEPHRPLTPPAGRVGLRIDEASVAPAPDAPLAVVDAVADVPAGGRVAVVGPSGCGKSTLLAAALRLLPLERGRIELRAAAGRTDLRDVAAADVPPLVAGSLQGDHVFAASLRDNLRVVRPRASDAELDAVAAQAGLAAFVAGLPDGWDTPAGADGAGLSGGQRQRLLLARALLAAPAVLVLDEPTAHLDAETEREVLADVLSATRGRTVLFSTHRALPPGAVDALVDLGGELGQPVPPGPRRPAGAGGAELMEVGSR